MKKLNKKGFTLIELLVVVAIIAILAGIVLVSLNSARERSRKASLQSTVASVMPVVAMCVNDGGTVQAPTSMTAGGGRICTGVNVADIDEEWPGLAHISGATYQYITINNGSGATDVVTAGEGTTVIVSCSMATGSCVLQ